MDAVSFFKVKLTKSAESEKQPSMIKANLKFPVMSASLPNKGEPKRIIIIPSIFTKPIAAPALPGNKSVALLNKAA